MSKKQSKRISGEIYTKMGSMGAELLGLAPPYGSAPYKPNKHFIYIRKGENKLNVGFAANYSAKKFLDLVIADDTVHRTRGITGDEDTLVTSTDIVIRCETLDEILNHQLTATEREWGLPDQGNGGTMPQAYRIRSSTERVVREEPSSDEVRKPKKEKVECQPKPSKDGLISIAEIAAELKMEARDCRAILRQQKVEKPAAGWAWSKIEVDEIKTLLHNHKE